MIHRFTLVAARAVVTGTLLTTPMIAHAESPWVPIQKEAPSAKLDPSLIISAHVGLANLGDLPDGTLTAGGGLRWPLSRAWGVGATLEFGYSYGGAVLGPQEYETLFGVARLAAIAFLDDRGFFRLDATLGVGPARFSVTGFEATVSETVVSYVIGVGLGIGWFHIETEYFGHRAEPCEPPSNGAGICYGTELGGAVLLGVQIPIPF